MKYPNSLQVNGRQVALSVKRRKSKESSPCGCQVLFINHDGSSDVVHMARYGSVEGEKG